MSTVEKRNRNRHRNRHRRRPVLAPLFLIAAAAAAALSSSPTAECRPSPFGGGGVGVGVGVGVGGRIAHSLSRSGTTSTTTTTTTPVRRRRSAEAMEAIRGGGGGVKGARGARGGAAAAAATRTMSASRMKMFNLFSGGVAGTIASCVTNPLEVVKTQLQSSSTSAAAHGELSAAAGHPITIAKTIMERDGVFGFWRGLRPTLVGIIPARSAYFFAYEQSKRALGSWGLSEGGVLNALISGLAAGVAGNTLTNPIWMVKTRVQLLADSSAGQRAYTGYRDAVRSIYREEGIGGFYRGITASYWGCAEGCIQFVLYERIKSELLSRRNAERERRGLPPTDKLPKATYFCSAAAAKAVAAVTTYPHEVARTRLREQARSGVFKYKGMWQTIGLVAREEGSKGLYAGMGVHLMKVVPNSAIMFLTYEVVNSWLGQFTVVED